MAGAVLYGRLLMMGLRTWWVDAVGTTALRLSVSPAWLAAGAVAVMLAAVACIWWTLRALARVSERSLLAGTIVSEEATSRSRSGRSSLGIAAGVLFAVALLLTIAASRSTELRTGAFFGAGAAHAGGVPLPARVAMAPAAPDERRGAWVVVGRAPGRALRDRSSGQERPRCRGDGGSELHSDLGRCLPAGWPRSSPRPAFRRRRLRADRRLAAAYRPRSQQPRGPRTSRFIRSGCRRSNHSA